MYIHLNVRKQLLIIRSNTWNNLTMCKQIINGK